MAAIFSKSIPVFRVGFDIPNLELSLLDLIQSNYSNYGTLSEFKGLFQCKDPDGSIFYQNGGYSITTPNFSNPDPDGDTLTWGVTGIDIPLDADGLPKKGTYTFNYVCTNSNGAGFVVVTKTYNYQYISPVVTIELTASCDESLLTSKDATNYNYQRISNVFDSPATLTQSHTVTPPSDSGFYPLPGTTEDAIRYIGGGNTDATELWTNTWQTDISTILQYNVEKWGATNYWWIIINDTVTGHKDIPVVCANCDCELLPCYLNLLARYDEAEKGHRRGAFELREVVIKATAYMTAYSKELECGEDTTQTCNDLKALLASYDCSCGQVESTSSRPIPKRRGGSGSSRSSTPFHFTFVESPTGGNSGDINWNTVNNQITQNVGGTWTLMYTITTVKGDSGKDGSDGSATSILWNDVSLNATGSGTNEQTLKSYTLGAGIMANDDDMVRIIALFSHAANDNGKRGALNWAGDMLIDYFTDELIDADSNKALI